ncbi:hypothetical protein ACEU6E_08035 [Halorutilales archaeon Cl-col2-1]
MRRKQESFKRGGGKRRRQLSKHRRSQSASDSDSNSGDSSDRGCEDGKTPRQRDDPDRRRRRKEDGHGRRCRDSRGQYVETVTRKDILGLLERIPGPVITTSDVSETFEITTEGARCKLNSICDDGVLERRKSGQTHLYWRTDDTNDTQTSNTED